MLKLLNDENIFMEKNKMNHKPSVIFMGSKPGSVVALSILLDRGWDVKYVVTTKHISDKWTGDCTLTKLANDNKIPIVLQKDIPRDQELDFVLSYMFRYRVRNDVISLAKKAALNFHPAPLPDFFGWGSYNIAIIEDSEDYGCTCHYMVEEFDSGTIVKINRFPIDAKKETAYSLEQKTQEEMIRLFLDFCQLAEENSKLASIPQDKSKHEFITRDKLEIIRKIPDCADDETIEKYARAFWYPPYEGAYIEVNKRYFDVIPKIARKQLGLLLHQDDVKRLKKVAQSYSLPNK